MALVLAGCDQGAGRGGGSGDVAADRPATAVEANALSPAELEAQAATALRIALGAAPARLARLRAGANGAICGEAETLPTATSPGGPRLFLVDRAGEAFVSRTEELGLEDPTDPFPNLYVQWCATPEEVRAIRERLARMNPADVALPPPPLPDALPPLPGVSSDPDAETPPEPPPPAPPPPRPRPRPRDDDSFFNVVVRPER